MLTPIATWILGLMLMMMPPRQNDVARLREYVILAVVISETTPEPEDQTLLVSIAWFESGFSIHAVGRAGEVGPFQLMGPPAAPKPPTTVRGQAKEALRRWKTQGPCGYAGEYAPHCPLGRNRALRAAMLLAAFPPPTQEFLPVVSFLFKRGWELKEP